MLTLQFVDFIFATYQKLFEFFYGRKNDYIRVFYDWSPDLSFFFQNELKIC